MVILDKVERKNVKSALRICRLIDFFFFEKKDGIFDYWAVPTDWPPRVQRDWRSVRRTKLWIRLNTSSFIRGKENTRVSRKCENLVEALICSARLENGKDFFNPPGKECWLQDSLKLIHLNASTLLRRSAPPTTRTKPTKGGFSRPQRA